MKTTLFKAKENSNEIKARSINETRRSTIT